MFNKRNEMRKVENNILAAGEATNHHHRANGHDVAVLETEEGDRYLEAPTGATITHEEHAPFSIPPGEYERLIVQQIDPFTDEIKNVVD